MAEHDNVFRLWVLLDLASVVGGDSGCSKEAGVLIHIKGFAFVCIRWQLLSAYCTDKFQGRHGQRSGASDLVVPRRRRIIFQQEEGV